MLLTSLLCFLALKPCPGVSAQPTWGSEPQKSGFIAPHQLGQRPWPPLPILLYSGTMKEGSSRTWGRDSLWHRRGHPSPRPPRICASPAPQGWGASVRG